MLTKNGLKKDFEKDWKKYYEVDLFREKGFSRRTCSCGKNFWTLDSKRDKCGDPPCVNYDFIGKKFAKKLDYVKMWKEFESFFASQGHTSVPRYPVIDRWRPDLFFTIASIQDFQRIDFGKMSFVYPENPLVVPQVCLRFPDIPSVGLSGRHLTSFIMAGQHAFNYPKEGYFKDKCLELNFNFLTKSLGIKPENLTYIEDLWAMPDFSAFGPSMETFVGGLEVANSVFMEFQAVKSGFIPLDMKVIDVGWGHERLVWLSNATDTMYDCVFGDLIKKLQKYTGISPDKNIFSKYSKLAGGLNIDEAKNLEKVRREIAKSIGISEKQLIEQIEPLRALYAIADHSRTLLFAIADGGIPSNVGGGYNLRVILRRALAFLDEYNLNLNLLGIAEKHAEFLNPIFPELKESLPAFEKILDIETKKYKATLAQGRKIVFDILDKKEALTEDKLTSLYESQGVTPELIKQVAKEKNIPVEIPETFYESISSKHIIEKEKEKKIDLDLSGLEKTKVLFYEFPEKKEFEAKILRVTKDWVVLNKTLFYPESGGQEYDTGELSGKKVLDVQKFGGVIAHKLSDTKGLKEGQQVSGKIKWDRRSQLMKHHTAIHILNGTVKKVLGKHAWQAGTHKSEGKATLDVTHYQSLTEEEIEKIEALANEIIKKSIQTKSNFIPRLEAEKTHGLGIYQGGHIPEKTLRILEIPGHDVEACSGTHCSNTSEIGKIIITNTEKIQDGIIRITIKAGPAAEKYLEESSGLVKYIAKTINDSKIVQVSLVEENTKKIIEIIKTCSNLFSVSPEHLKSNIQNFLSEIENQHTEINRLKKISKEQAHKISIYKAKDLEDTCKHIFELWKEQKKQIESLGRDTARSAVDSLIGKASNNQVFDIVRLDRKELILTASEVIKKKPELTIILSNEAGDLIVMTKTKDAGKLIKEICSKIGGSGGGSKELAQGKVDLSKLIKIMSA